MGRKALLFVLVLVVGLAFAVYVVAQTFNAPTVDVPASSEFGTGTGGTGGTEIVPAVVETNESENAEIEKIDSDGDGMSDWFEENYTLTDPKVANDRYLLIIDAFLEADRKQCRKYILDGSSMFVYRANGFLPENIIIKEKATFADFKRGVSQIAEMSDENDFIYVELSTHGGPKGIDDKPYMRFKDEKQQGYENRNYEEVGQILNEIKCQKMLVMYTSCAGNSGMKPLTNNTAYPRVAINSEPQLGNKIYGLDDAYYEIRDDYLSAENLFKYFPWREDGKIADPYNIAETFYFGETKLKDIHKPKAN